MNLPKKISFLTLALGSRLSGSFFSRENDGRDSDDGLLTHHYQYFVKAASSVLKGWMVGWMALASSDDEDSSYNGVDGGRSGDGAEGRNGDGFGGDRDLIFGRG